MLHAPSGTKARYRMGINLFFFVMGLIFASWAGRIPDVQAALRLNDADLGTALFGASLGQLPAMLLSGLLVSRFGSRHVLAVGLAAYAAALIALGLAQSFSHLFMALFLFGIGGNLFDNAVNTQAVGLEKLYRRSIMASAHALWSFGGVTGAVAGALCAAWGFAPYEQFLGTAALAALVWLVLRRWTLPRDVFTLQPTAPPDSASTASFPEEAASSIHATSPVGTNATPARVLPANNTMTAEAHCPYKRRNATRPKVGLRQIRPDMFIFLLGLVAFGSMATEGGMYDWSSVYFTSVVQAAETYTRSGYIACMSAMVLGRCVADALITRYGYVTVLRVSGLFMSGGLCLLIVLPVLIPATVGAALVGLGMSAGVPICFSLAGKSRRVPPSVAISLVTAISFSGFMFCPPLIGHLAHALSLRWALVPIAALGIVIALASPRLRTTLEKNLENNKKRS